MKIKINDLYKSKYSLNGYLDEGTTFITTKDELFVVNYIDESCNRVVFKRKTSIYHDYRDTLSIEFDLIDEVLEPIKGGN
jgi:hypothetical protein